MAVDRACHRGDEFNDGLMRQAHRIFDNAAPENFGCDPLLPWKAAIESIDQDVGINESGHADRDPLSSILGREAARWRGPLDVCGCVRSLDRTNGAGIPGLEVQLVCSVV
jgi:hypothetical protein